MIGTETHCAELWSEIGRYCPSVKTSVWSQYTSKGIHGRLIGQDGIYYDVRITPLVFVRSKGKDVQEVRPFKCPSCETVGTLNDKGFNCKQCGYHLGII